MTKQGCVLRLQKEYRTLCNEPAPNIVARPSPRNILVWHYVLEGCEGTPFAGGYYYGKIVFPPEYPYKPPGIRMTTPNGRFVPNKNICPSMRDWNWTPLWSVSGILTGLLSFMLENCPTMGTVTTTVAEKERLAKASLAFNCTSAIFRELFPEYVEKYEHQRWIASQFALEQVSPHVDISHPLAEENINTRNEDHQRKIDKSIQSFLTSKFFIPPRVGISHPLPEGNNNTRIEDYRRKMNQIIQSYPNLPHLLSFSIFGVVMALPLLRH